MDTLHILAVDDEPEISELYQVTFRKDIKAGAYQFLFAKDGQDALNTLAQHPEITVVLADINMPGMDGLTLLAKIHEQSHVDQTWQFVKVIMITAYGDKPNIRRSLNAGAFDFIEKPIDAEDIRLTMQKAAQETAKLRNFYACYKQEQTRRMEAEKKLLEVESYLTGALTGGNAYGF